MNTLRIKVLDESLESLYKKRVNVEGDAGVDLYFPDEVTIPSKALGLKVDLKIQAEMVQEVNSQLMTNIPKEMRYIAMGGVGYYEYDIEKVKFEDIMKIPNCHYTDFTNWDFRFKVLRFFKRTLDLVIGKRFQVTH